VETEDEALVRQVLEVAIAPATPSNAEIHAAYAATPEQWRAPTLYEAAHILLPVRPGDATALANAQAQAEMLLSELHRNPRAFDNLARENSACSSRASGGRLGQLMTGDTVPEFEAAMDALAQGKISPAPVPTRYGLHIIRLDARAPGEILPFEAVAPRITEMLEKAAWANAARDFVEQLSETAVITGVKLKAA
ncbi:peptidylprolyl isomerase, partial [Pseudorhodobacter sp.]|uniref:peptidylprolyl isomerase n=1 Tax=Pseudorhodobacter sp. TaxID=1934400 RepID=UPI002648C4AC